MGRGTALGAGAALVCLIGLGCGRTDNTGNAEVGQAAGTGSDSGFITEDPRSNKDPDVTSTQVTHKFTGNIADANAGRVLFMTHNCVGCHGGLAGGAMGPSLRDTVWKYGGTDQALYASIHDGRPQGMPAWGQTSSVVGQQGDTLSDQQIKQIVTYIRSLRTSDEPTFFFWNQRQVAGKS
jgi:cytochrome c551/c552